MDRRKSNKDIYLRKEEVNSISSNGVKILIAGAGGQGILALGKILAQSFLLDDKNVTWLPSYGAEVRGGACKCMVVVSQDEIASPYIFNPDYFIVMNEQSYKKYAHSLNPQGKIFYNETLIKNEILIPDIFHIPVPATRIAIKLNNPKVANIVMLAKFIKEEKLISPQIIDDVISNFKKEFYELNKEAFQLGFSL
jgi:2-oxoglutarate ferredoxin oxidoreductase subunit gamma